MKCHFQVLSFCLHLNIFLQVVEGIEIFSVEEELIRRPNDAGVLRELDVKRNLNEYASPIANLNDLLIPFAKENFMTVLSSYRIVDFPMLGFPVISIKLQPVYADVGSTFKNVLWYPTISANMTASSAYCPKWKYWDPFCGKLDLSHIPWLIDPGVGKLK